MISFFAKRVEKKKLEKKRKKEEEERKKQREQKCEGIVRVLDAYIVALNNNEYPNILLKKECSPEEQFKHDFNNNGILNPIVGRKDDDDDDDDSLGGDYTTYNMLEPQINKK